MGGAGGTQGGIGRGTEAVEENDGSSMGETGGDAPTAPAHCRLSDEGAPRGPPRLSRPHATAAGGTDAGKARGRDPLITHAGGRTSRYDWSSTASVPWGRCHRSRPATRPEAEAFPDRAAGDRSWAGLRGIALETGRKTRVNVSGVTPVARAATAPSSLSSTGAADGRLSVLLSQR